ncbi:hypothetical protein BDB00DRAFT_286878 [Zychaea mexicana]|uniref:uncharacterized protein n=1 Tax=Zychaea mexicana TaxID=64656 RepID=UPI0022FE38D1|nr:uncharacterized protein BDB00DRAFT_286878 [Zychaea mexicana]KAI9494735.1 hypothetical protein BDB00DRAFT_286878 [Zychaea mexicana]
MVMTYTHIHTSHTQTHTHKKNHSTHGTYFALYGCFFVSFLSLLSSSSCLCSLAEMKQRRRPRHFSPSSFCITPLPLLLVLIALICLPTAIAQQQPMLDTSFTNEANFTQCSDPNTFIVHSLSRSYDHATNTFSFNLSGHSSIAVTNLNPGQNRKCPPLSV